jgi:hypothetical protein
MDSDPEKASPDVERQVAAPRTAGPSWRRRVAVVAWAAENKNDGSREKRRR